MENLSKQIHNSDSFSVRGLDVIAVEDIKHFIRKLKDTIREEHLDDNEINLVIEDIDMLVGNKLNSEKAVKTCATKHVIPPKSKDSGILPNFT